MLSSRSALCCIVLFSFILVVRLVLFGVTGEGKSATANTIGGPDVDCFEPSLSMISHTEKCASHVFEDEDRRYQVIDTPGLFDNRRKLYTQTKTMVEISKSISLSLPGPDAFLMITAIGHRYSDQYDECFRLFKQMFGNAACR